MLVCFDDEGGLEHFALSNFDASDEECWASKDQWDAWHAENLPTPLVSSDSPIRFDCDVPLQVLTHVMTKGRSTSLTLRLA